MILTSCLFGTDETAQSLGIARYETPGYNPASYRGVQNLRAEREMVLSLLNPGELLIATNGIPELCDHEADARLVILGPDCCSWDNIVCFKESVSPRGERSVKKGRVFHFGPEEEADLPEVTYLRDPRELSKHLIHNISGW